MRSQNPKRPTGDTEIFTDLLGLRQRCRHNSVNMVGSRYIPTANRLPTNEVSEISTTKLPNNNKISSH